MTMRMAMCVSHDAYHTFERVALALKASSKQHELGGGCHRDWETGRLETVCARACMPTAADNRARVQRVVNT